MGRLIKWNVGIILGAVFLGLLMLVGVHCLPKQTMLKNVYWSKDTLQSEFSDEVLLDGYTATLTGSFTDCLMLEHAIYDNPEHTVLEQALRMYRAESSIVEERDSWWPGHSLIDYLEGIDQPREVEYSRYWHGYLIVLKPLLMITSVNGLRFINGTCQLFLLCVVIYACGKKRKDGLAIAYMLAMPYLYFISSYASMSLSICYYILAIASLIMLLFFEQLEKRNWVPLFFLLVGIATSYFDFLTYPIVTLCYPLCIYLYLKSKTSFKCLMGQVLLCSVEWGLGYGVMWASKWVLSDILVGTSTIRDALMTIGVRSQSAEGYGRVKGFLEVISLNLKPYANINFYLIAIVMAIIILVQAKRIGILACRIRFISASPYFFVALIPFGWWFLMQNHSQQHWVYTCRIFAVVVFAVLCGLEKVVQDEEML